MMYGTTSVGGNGGCLYCGCTCSATACIAQSSNWVVVVAGFDNTGLLDMRRGMREFDIDRLLGQMKAESTIRWFPDWLIETKAIPRRMKRPFPRNLPGPSRCHFNSHPTRRSSRRIRRLWRSSSRTVATAVRFTRPSRVGEIVPAVGYRPQPSRGGIKYLKGNLNA